MSGQSVRPAKWLRGAAIALMALSVAFTLLGGIGTTCVAFAAERWGSSMAALAPHQWLYQILVVVSLVAGAFGVGATVGLARGRRRAFRDALIVLAVAALAAGVQMAVSQSVRGKSAPVNVRFYVTAFTLGVFLLLRWTPAWARVGFDGALGGSDGPSGAAAAAVALLLGGLVTLTTPLWAGPTHIFDGENVVYRLGLPLALAGGGMTLGGLGCLAVALGLPRRMLPARRQARQGEGELHPAA